ncbi:hypothetical protein LEP1GSC005_1654 [Leptospira santarosai str. ST188]|uniref:hypothetical protein n=1 Tax=Leptospira santarosai TaxID=28183 RepID=UPI00029842AB|nr:hypothetical protein [Leptospira santarosai]EKS09222.1 hypothetical protein LEP1GSC071_2825 [Leptospira santarosai str. JET]EMF88751.1 hypothetical protein LEP1GSC005_1654 [Leptospira santarosai str. ST188]
MIAEKIFKGIGIIVDDEIDVEKSIIQNIIEQIREKEIPYIPYKSLPSDGVIDHFRNISFILLDWRLSPIPDTKLPQGLNELLIKENISFLKKIKKSCFCPIFIFSNEDHEQIITRLVTEGLIKDNDNNHIFVRSKSELKGKTKLFKALENWIKNNPSVYVLKEWEREYFDAKNKLFSEFHEMNPNWPKILWKTFISDHSNESMELGELISRNIHTRMTPFEFSGKILNKKGKKSNQSEILKVIEGGRYLKNEFLNSNDIAPGDIFYFNSEYYINIRAACDCIPDRNKPEEKIDDVQLYLLRGGKIGNQRMKKDFLKKFGHFSELDSQFIAYPIYENKGIDFRFKRLYQMEWKVIKEKRLGRLLPPYINKLQQKYSSYLQRQGLPRLPNLRF